MDHTFYRFTGVITHLGCWENTRTRVLPTSRVGYHAGKPIEGVVYYLMYTLSCSSFSHCVISKILLNTRRVALSL